MAGAIERKSVARYALFGMGALLLHGAAAWALPAPAARTTAILVDFSLMVASAEAPPDADSGSMAGAARAVPVGSQAPTTTRARIRYAASSARQDGVFANKPSATADKASLAADTSVPAAAPEATSQLEPTDHEADDARALAAGPRALDAEGGSAAGGAQRARTSGATGSGTGGSGTGAASATSHGPALLALGNPCSAFFPAQADADRGEVQLEVEVDASGHAHASAVLLELPHGQGFAGAARECARQLQFAPAMSQGGAPTTGHAKLKLRFKRRTV
jgi:outer membrane biosynthesis protein TonB